MTQERFKMIVYTAIILHKKEKILLIRRSNTGRFDGFYAVPGGGVDGNEPVTQALIREAHEEIGITIKKENLRVVHVLHDRHRESGKEFIGFYIEAIEWEGEPQNMEPNKHDEVVWIDENALPKNLLDALRHVLEMIRKDIFYSEYGWEK
jgi:ADP-ribose pyrophosphatase YjhB (NUDIX family)